MRYDPTRDPDDGKLRELILYIAQWSSDDPRFGATKLNKLLFFADFLAYVKLGSSITGQPYQRLPNGPTPSRVVPIMNEMAANDELAIAERNYYGRIQRSPIPLREPNLKLFTAEEIGVVGEVLSSLKKQNARGVSALSHKFKGWKLAAHNETIPYQVVLASLKKPRKRDLAAALAMGEELKLLRKECDSLNAD